jgi:ABC-type antimicrobial peptide transport system permease subunit
MLLSHYVKLAFRNFQRHRSSFLINLIGLSSGLAGALLIFLWVNDELKVDKFFENDAEIFRVLEHQPYADGIMTTNSTPGPLAKTLGDDYPEIKHAATVVWNNDMTLFNGDKGFDVEGRYVGTDFLKILTFPIIAGEKKEPLKDINSIVLSKSVATSMFGSPEAAIGKTIDLDHEFDCMVSAVIEDVPTYSSLKFDVLLSFEKFRQGRDWVYQWGNNGPRTYVTLQAGTDYQQFSEKIKDLLKEKDEGTRISLFLKPYSESYLYGRYENGKQAGGRIDYVRLFSVIAIFILIIACINFMNLSTARASRRAKEVGVKKAIGAERGALISQYLSESLLIAFASLLFAVAMVLFVLPKFNDIVDKEIVFNWSPTMLGGFLLITIFTGLLAGSYPAFYLSSFQPVKVLKGTIKSSLGELWARRGLVVFQFTLSIILIVSVFVVYQQIQYAQSKNLGYDKEHLIKFPILGQLDEKLESFLAEARNLPGVSKVSSLGHNLMGRNNNTHGLKWEGKNPDDRILFENMSVNYGLLEAINIKLKEGRYFSKEFGADSTKIIFNEAAIKVMGLEDPIGQTIRLWEEYDMEIIGVVEDFHFQSLHEPVNPVFFRLNPENAWVVMASFEPGKEKEAIAGLQNLHDKFNPGFEFDYSFQDEDYARLYSAEQRVATLASYFAGFAILISCLGLFGLAAFTADRKKKEIGIRKVLGASVMNIITLLTKDFTRLVFVSILIGLPIAWYIASDWLGKFAFRIELSPWFFLIAGVLVLLISWLTVSSQAFSSAMVNPKDCLKDE